MKGKEVHILLTAGICDFQLPLIELVNHAEIRCATRRRTWLREEEVTNHTAQIIVSFISSR